MLYLTQVKQITNHPNGCPWSGIKDVSEYLKNLKNFLKKLLTSKSTDVTIRESTGGSANKGSHP